MSSFIIDVIKCKGIIQQGPRKGLQCQRDTTDTGYCVYHTRNYEHETLTKSGKTLCNGFFRGCNNQLDAEDMKQSRKFCETCRTKKLGKQYPCQHNGCSFKIKCEEDKYCDKHVREHLRDIEREKNVQYCDISRGCFNLLDGDIKCKECRNNEKEKAKYEMTQLRQHYNIILPERIEKNELFEKQESIVSEIKEVWRTVQRNAIARKMVFTLTQQELEKLVIQPCYYCGFYSDYKFIGIDRIDNNKGYILDNCVPACKMCNMIKNKDHPIAFLDKIELICSYKQFPKSIRNKTSIKWDIYLSSGRKITYSEYKTDVKGRTKHIEFLLTEEEYNTLINGECYLCGINPMDGHRNGIDRIDSNGHYTLENSKTCCGHCNRMKRDYSYEHFMSKCIQIKTHACDRSRFQGIPYLEPTVYKLTKEYYRADEISKFLKDGYLTRFLEWCEEKQKTPEFTSTITCIASKLEGDIEEQIRRELDNERARKVGQSKQPEKKHLHAATVYAWLTGGKEDEFLKWYSEQYEKTQLFNSRFKELKELLPTISREEGIKSCKKFMYDEKSRRNSQRGRDEKRIESKETSESSTVTEYKNILVPVVSKEKISKSKETILGTIPKKVNIEETKTTLRQWKVADIYDYIAANNEHMYYAYLQQSNDLQEVKVFEEKWVTLLQTVKSATRKEGETIIKSFVVWLRNIRHSKICAERNAKVSLDKEERQHYRADGILILFKTNNIDEIAKFKSYTESYAGDDSTDPKWIKRWTLFVTAVNNETTDESKKKLISKFLMAQRKKKMDRKHNNDT
jgi:hypothetical protein